MSSAFAEDDAGAVPLVPAGGSFEGQVAVVGRTRIAGSVGGSVKGPGTLVLDAGARVEGIIDCEIVDCRGEILGPVVARTRAKLAGRARFEGDLEAPVVEVDDDAVWIGEARVGF